MPTPPLTQIDRARAQLHLAKWVYDASPDVARQSPRRLYWESDPATGSNTVGRVEHPLDQTLGLVHYLLLTCFDILGSAAEWLSFGSWLEASRCRSEREAAGPLNLEDGVDAAKQLFRHYNRLYGARQSFHRFVEEVLTPEQRKQVLDSVELDGERAFDAQKLKRLYRIRSNFTHEGLAAGSVVAHLRAKAPHGLFAPDASIEEIDGVWALHEHAHMIGREEEGDWTSVKLWPHVLFDVLSQQIGETVLPDAPVLVEVFRSMDQRAFIKTPYRKYKGIRIMPQQALASLAEDRLRGDG